MFQLIIKKVRREEIKRENRWIRERKKIYKGRRNRRKEEGTNKEGNREKREINNRGSKGTNRDRGERKSIHKEKGKRY